LLAPAGGVCRGKTLGRLWREERIVADAS